MRLLLCPEKASPPIPNPQSHPSRARHYDVREYVIVRVVD